MNVSYFYGVVVGILVVVVIALVLRKNMDKGKEKPQYDERQLLARGRAYMWAFWSLLCYVALLGIAGEEMRIVQENILAFLMIGVCISCSVFGIYSVWNDAYVQVGRNPRRYMILTAVLGAMNIVAAFMMTVGHISHGEVFPVSVIVNLMLGVLMFAMSLTLFLKYRAECRDEEER